MMTIAKIQPDNTDYLFKHSNQEYFSESDNEIGTFKGKLAEWKGIEGKIATKELFDKEMSFNKEFKGVEIDPSACKDFSALYNRVSPDEREKLKGVWTNAMNHVCKAIEQNTYYRETKNGVTEYKLAKGVCMAQFDHHTARPVNGEVDFQIHSHIVVFPQVLGKDNKFHAHTLMDLKYEKNNHETLRYFDSVMNYHLAKGLNELNISVSPSKDGFKIDCIDKDVIDNFSKRTNQINEIAGIDSTYAEKKKVSLKIRENKSENNLTNLREAWQEKMDSMGFTQSKIFRSKQQDFDKSLSEISRDKDKHVFSNKGIKTLAYQQATFSTKTFDEKFQEFQSDKKLARVSTHQNIYKSNYSMSRLATELKTRTMKKSLAKKPSSKKSAKPSKPTRAIKSSNSSQVKPSASLFQQTTRSGETVQECLTEIKNIEQELSSLKLDDPQRQKLEAKIGELKNKMKDIEKEGKQSQKASATISSEQSTFKVQSEHEEPDEKEKEKDEKSRLTKKEQIAEKEEKGETKTLTDEFEEKLNGNKQHLATDKLNDVAKDIIKQDIQANIQAIQQVQQTIDVSPSL